MNKDSVSADILRTKLYKPRVPKNYLHRSCLRNRLEQWVNRPMTLVCAPAGYGKSTLLSSWLDRTELPGAWISLDKNENNLRLFLSYMTAAVHTIFPGSLEKTQNLLAASSLPHQKELLNSMVNEIDRIDHNFILVLDDYHLINNQSVHQLISEMVKYPPPNLHLMLASRVDPPLGLSRLRARRQMGELRLQDLRLDPEEIRAFFEKELSIKIDQGAENILNKKLEGWVTGLRLTALLLKGKSDINPLISNLPVDSRHITDYLVSEVLHSLPEKIESFLLVSSILHRFNASLCDAVCIPLSDSLDCRMGGINFIKWLRTSELFVIPLDDQTNWLRYHHLFQSLLMRRLKQRISPEQITTMQMQASQWFAANDLIDEAIDYAIDAKEYLRAAQLIEENYQTPLNGDKWFVLDRWLDKLPQKIVNQRPQLIMTRVWVLNNQLALSDIPPLLEKITDLCPEGMPDGLETQRNVIRGILLYWEGKNRCSLSLLRSVLDKIPQKFIGIKNECLIYLAMSSHGQGLGEEIIKEYQGRLSSGPIQGSYKLRLIGSIVFVHLLSGELDRTDDVAQDLMKASMELKNRHIEAWSLYLRGIVHYQSDRLENAIRFFSRALEKMASLDVNMNMDCYAGLILSYQAMDQPEKAKDAMKEMMAFARKTGNLDTLHLACSIEARLNLLQGRMHKAMRWQETTEFSSDARQMLFWLEIPRITQCRILIAQGSAASLDKAGKKLIEYTAFNQKVCNVPQMIELHFLQALLYHKQGKTDRASSALDKGTALARQGGYTRCIAGLSPGVKDLLPGIPSYKRVKKFIDNSLGLSFHDNVAGENDPGASHIEPLPIARAFETDIPLTRRECEILSNVSQGLSNKEVALRLYISPDTVKKHTGNIYQKLGVHNRQQAALKAKQIGLVK